MRERNGWIDNGERLRNSAKRCPKCRSEKYIETLSREKCDACGLECDYWGGGPNAVYEEYSQQLWAERERQEEEEFQRLYGD